MQVRENLAMDAGTTFTQRKTYTISRFTLIFLSAILICSIIAAGLLIYNFATCPQISVQSQVCEANHVIPLNPRPGEHSDRSATISIDGTTNTTTDDDKYNLRLPRSIQPLSYDIKLIPFLFENNFTFNGDVKIIVNITENCKNITLHAIALKIKSSDVVVRRNSNGQNRLTNGGLDKNNGNSTSGDIIEINRQYSVDSKQFYVIELNETLETGALYEIQIQYTGILNDLLQGFYRSAYNVGNETR